MEDLREIRNQWVEIMELHEAELLNDTELEKAKDLLKVKIKTILDG